MIQRLGADLVQRNFDMKVQATLGNIEIQHGYYHAFNSEEKPLYIIENPLRNSNNALVLVELTTADRNGPFFIKDHQATETKLEAKFDSLNINLHQEALVSLHKFANKLLAEIAKTQQKKEAEPQPSHLESDKKQPLLRRLSRSISQSSQR